ncbi:MAG TPA: response regulator transcription factor [Dermatophilaceae bacterium]|nr:response regulator transcription factor [Dermatophilaceae bacterium]
MITVGLVDDQELMREGLALIIDAQPDMRVVGQASDGADAVRLARVVHPDVILMDVRMPRMTGVDATRRIVADQPAAKVLVLTMFDLDEYVYDALRAGASGFLLKDAPRGAVVHAIRAVVAGDILLAPEVTRRLVERYAGPPTGKVRAPEALRSVTDREREVLFGVVRGCTNAEIAHALTIGEATVKTHVAHLLTKLGLRDRLQLVIFAYETGLVTPGAAPVRPA